MVQLTDAINVPDDAISMRFVLASGPGGQNVNKVATAVQLRFDLTRSGLPDAVLDRLRKIAGTRLVRNREILIEARRFRTQERNRSDALERLGALIAQALVVPNQRIATRPSRAQKARRVDHKTRRGETKAKRRPPKWTD